MISPRNIDLREIKRVRPDAQKLESYTMGHLPLNTLQVDRSYQRDLDHVRVKSMAKDFSPMMLLPFAVNIRTDGSRYTIDGQHRTGMLHELGKGNIDVACAIYHGLTVEEEAWLYDELNKTQKKLSPLEQYRGGLAAGDPVIAEINQAVNQAGFVVRTEQRDLSRSNISGVASLRRVRKQHGTNHLYKTLQLIAETWGTNHGPSSQIINAVADFLHIYEGSFRPERFRRVFTKENIGVLSNQVKVIKVNGGLDEKVAWNLKFVEIYNKGANESVRIPTIIEIKARGNGGPQ